MRGESQLRKPALVIVEIGNLIIVTGVLVTTLAIVAKVNGR